MSVFESELCQSIIQILESALSTIEMYIFEQKGHMSNFTRLVGNYYNLNDLL